MFGLGTTELLIILAVCLLIFGARRLPEIGRGLGEAIRNFKSGTKEIIKDIDVEKQLDEGKGKEDIKKISSKEISKEP